MVREALREWKLKRVVQGQELAALKADIEKGLADVAAGRVRSFDKAKIMARGEEVISQILTLRLTESNGYYVSEVRDAVLHLLFPARHAITV